MGPHSLPLPGTTSNLFVPPEGTVYVNESDVQLAQPRGCRDRLKEGRLCPSSLVLTSGIFVHNFAWIRLCTNDEMFDRLSFASWWSSAQLVLLLLCGRRSRQRPIAAVHTDFILSQQAFLATAGHSPAAATVQWVAPLARHSGYQEKRRRFWSSSMARS